MKRCVQEYTTCVRDSSSSYCSLANRLSGVWSQPKVLTLDMMNIYAPYQLLRRLVGPGVHFVSLYRIGYGLREYSLKVGYV